MTRSLLIALALALPATAAAEPASIKLDKLVTFEPGKRRIYSEGRAEIRSVARQVRATCPAATVTVEGNAYFPDDEEKSIALGQGRADLVRRLLVKYGLEARSVVAVGVARATLADGNGRHVDLVIDCPASPR